MVNRLLSQACPAVNDHLEMTIAVDWYIKPNQTNKQGVLKSDSTVSWFIMQLMMDTFFVCIKYLSYPIISWLFQVNIRKHAENDISIEFSPWCHTNRNSKQSSFNFPLSESLCGPSKSYWLNGFHGNLKKLAIDLKENPISVCRI